MLPFCGYNMGDYFAHWLKVGQKADESKLPKIFYVNWFKKDDDGRIVWPGFGENSRVIKWIVQRLEGEADAVETPIGYLPTSDGIDIEGLDISEEDMKYVLDVDRQVWKQEAALVPEFFTTFGDHLPSELWAEYHALVARLDKA